jgi:hypothetical protein
MFRRLREWLVLVAHLIVTIIKMAAPNGLRAVVADSLPLKHQRLVLNRSRKKAQISPPRIASCSAWARCS